MLEGNRCTHCACKLRKGPLLNVTLNTVFGSTSETAEFDVAVSVTNINVSMAGNTAVGYGI